MDIYKKENYQVVILHPDGRVKESCNSIVDLSAFKVLSLFDEIPVFIGIKGELEKRGDSGNMELDCVETDFAGRPGIYDFVLSKTPHQYVLAFYDRTDYYNQMRKLQQERNDVSILKEMLDQKNQSLKKLNEDLDQFASMVAHDLRNPLAAASNFAALIKESASGSLDDSQIEMCNNVLISLKRAMAIVNGLYEYAKIEKEKMNVSVIDVEESLKSIIKTLSVPETVKVIVAEKLPIFKTQKILLEQVFQNLISNAIKYNDKGKGEIAIKCNELGDHYEFSVADNGPGIPEGYKKKIFGMFQTLPGRSKIDSAGIGLAIVAKIINDRNETISVKSQVAQGADFTFTWRK